MVSSSSAATSPAAAASSSGRRPHFVQQHDRGHHRWRWFTKVFVPATLSILALYWLGERWTRYSLFRFQEGTAVQQARQPNNFPSDISHNSTTHPPYTPIPDIPIGKDIAGDMVYMPILGVGTGTFHPVRAYESVCKALGEGYTLIDTAWSYKNQQGIGKAIRDCWLHRQEEDSFLTSSPLQALRGQHSSSNSKNNESTNTTMAASQDKKSKSPETTNHNNIHTNEKSNSITSNSSEEGRSRKDLFILTKIPGGLTLKQVWVYHEKNLADLGLTYVDHLMIDYRSGKSSSSSSPEQRQEEWQALQEIYASGQARTIGVSHYCSQHLEEILSTSNYIVGPAINQMEYHVGSGTAMNQVLETCRKHNITFMSYSPLCGSACSAPNATAQLTSPMSAKDGTNTSSLVHLIAQNYPNVTETQVSLRFIIQQALAEANVFGGMGGVVPRTNTLRHMQENRRVLDFQLTEEDMQQLHTSTQPAPNVGSNCEGD